MNKLRQSKSKPGSLSLSLKGIYWWHQVTYKQIEIADLRAFLEKKLQDSETVLAGIFPSACREK